MLTGPANNQIRREPPKVGMQLNQLTDEIFCEVLKIYDQTVGPYPRNTRSALERWSSSHPDQKLPWIQRELDGAHAHNAVEWRFGSRLTEHAKLFIWWATAQTPNPEAGRIIRFAFDPNIVSGPEADTVANEFKAAVENLIESKGLAVPIKNY